MAGGPGYINVGLPSMPLTTVVSANSVLPSVTFSICWPAQPPHLSPSSADRGHLCTSASSIPFRPVTAFIPDRVSFSINPKVRNVVRYVPQ